MQKEPQKNEQTIKQIQALQLSEDQKTSLKLVKKEAKKKNIQIITSTLQLCLGIIEFKFGDFDHIKNFDNSGAVEHINNPIKSKNPLDLDDGG